MHKAQHKNGFIWLRTIRLLTLHPQLKSSERSLADSRKHTCLGIRFSRPELIQTFDIVFSGTRSPDGLRSFPAFGERFRQYEWAEDDRLSRGYCMDLNLSGDVVVVTGGASGIGEATAQLFLEEGADVYIWDLQSAANEQMTFQKVDITSQADTENAVQEILSTRGCIDHFVHAAAIGSCKFGFPFDNLTPDDWRRVLEVNIMGMTNVAHAVGPVMRTQQAGTMVFIASVAGQIGSQTDPPYSASKAANINFAQCLAKDLAPHGVRVNTICPGMIQTPLNRSVWQAWNDLQPEDQKRTYEDWADEKVRNVIPLRSWQTPQDIANMIAFLSSKRSAQVTGQTINVDGGFVMHW